MGVWVPHCPLLKEEPGTPRLHSQCWASPNFLLSTCKATQNLIKLFVTGNLHYRVCVSECVRACECVPTACLRLTVAYLWTWIYRRCIKIEQLDVTCFIISQFTAQRVSNVSTSIFRSLRLTVDLFHVFYCSGSMCVGVTVWFGWGGVVSLCRLKH